MLNVVPLKRVVTRGREVKMFGQQKINEHPRSNESCTLSPTIRSKKTRKIKCKKKLDFDKYQTNSAS